MTEILLGPNNVHGPIPIHQRDGEAEPMAAVVPQQWTTGKARGKEPAGASDGHSHKQECSAWARAKTKHINLTGAKGRGHSTDESTSDKVTSGYGMKPGTDVRGTDLVKT